MKASNQLTDRKFIRKMSQQLGLLSRSWAEGKAHKNSRDRNSRKLKSLWVAWDEDPSIRPVICQRMKKLAFESYYNREETIDALCKNMSRALWPNCKLDLEVVDKENQHKILMIKLENAKDILEINLEVMLESIIGVAESAEHKTTPIKLEN